MAVLRAAGVRASVVCGLGAIAAFVALTSPVPASARTLLVRSGESIQAMVDQALPDDVVHVQAGIYRAAPEAEAVVEIRTSAITLIGEPGAVIDATGNAYGVRIGAHDLERCATRLDVRDVRLVGFTIRGAVEAGVLVSNVEGFELRGGRYLDNVLRGPMVICSVDGSIEHGFVSGHRGAGVHIADDRNVRVTGNIITGNTIGVRLQRTAEAVVRGNFVTGNTAGLLVHAAAGLPPAFAEDTLIENNVVLENNRPNPFRPGPGLVRSLAQGTGILNVGADRVVIRSNFVLRNGTVGIATLGHVEALLDARIDPFVDDQEVRSNWVLGNGLAPDATRLPVPPADLVFLPDLVDPETGDGIARDPDPTDNCYAENYFAYDHPVGFVDTLDCTGS